MPITVAHNVDPGLLSAVALLTGQGRNQQALAAQGADEAYRQAQLAEQVRARRAQEQLAQAQFAQQGQQFDQRMLAADRDRNAQLYANDQRLGLSAWETAYQGGMQQSMLRDRLGAGLMERQMMGQQERMSAADRFGQQLQLAQMRENYGLRAGEEERILRALPKLDPWEQEELIGQFNERWTNLGLPGFQEISQEMEQAPLEEDPPAMASQSNQMLQSLGSTPSVYVNPKDGSLDTVFAPDKDPVHLKRVQEDKLKIELAKVEAKKLQDQARQQQQAAIQQQRQQQLKETFAQKMTLAQADAALKSALERAGSEPKWNEYADEVPDPASLTGGTKKVVNEAAYYNDKYEREAKIEAAYAAYERRVAELSGMPAQSQQPVAPTDAMPGSKENPWRPKNESDLLAVPSGQYYIGGDGKKYRKN